MNILCTFPGKLGDLLYTLPLIECLYKKFNQKIFIQTSQECESAKSLIEYQPACAGVLIDKEYVCLSRACGMQPAEMSEPAGFDKIFHLGFRRDIIGSPISHPHLIETHFKTMELRYGVQLKRDYAVPYIKLPSKVDVKENVILFGSYGDSVHLTSSARNISRAIVEKWKEIISELNQPIIAICSEKNKEWYEQFNCEIYCPCDLLEAAITINQCKLFIGVQSCPFVITDGLQAPRLILYLFRHCLPIGKNFEIFTVDEDIDSISKKINSLLFLSDH